MADTNSTSSLLDVSHLVSADDPDHPYSSWPSIPPNPIGRLALLTPEITSSAASSIRTGQRLSLDWPVYPSNVLLYGRKATVHTITQGGRGPKKLEDLKEGRDYQPMFDDHVHLNTQGTTQWDYFLHFSYHGSGLFFGGLTAEDVAKEATGEFGIAGEFGFRA
jgi:hypothetical protein